MTTCPRCGTETAMPFHTCKNNMKTPTDEQMNHAMCEWMGWTKGRNGLGARIWLKPGGTAWFSQGDLPNYLSDDSPRRLLNEAEAKMTGQQHSNYRQQVWKVTHSHDGREYLSASARQRTIAILKTVKPELFQ